MNKKAISCHSVLFLILLLTAGCAAERGSSRDFLVQKGVLDLRAWNSGESGPVFLRGEWKFLWKQLARDGLSLSKGGYINVPSTWDSATVHGEEISRYGYGTYLITILLPKGLKFSLRIPSIDSAYCLFIDGEKPFCNGTVEIAEKGSRTRYYAPAVLDLPVSDKPITLTF